MVLLTYRKCSANSELLSTMYACGTIILNCILWYLSTTLVNSVDKVHHQLPRVGYIGVLNIF